MDAVSKLNTEDRRRRRDLEEARKAGTAAPEVDEEGHVINPHIPNFIKEAPWYASTGAPTLRHQKKVTYGNRKEVGSMDDWYSRGEFQGPAATKFRKGACENCGAMTHKTRDCVERPRKKLAKYTSEDIKPDEVIREFELDYDGKHDRWNGYNPEMFKATMAQYEAREMARREIEAARAAAGIEESEPEDIQDPVFEETADPRTRTIVKNLRNRWDRAKYLHNLDLNSAYYDPKSRSMRENPYEGKNPEEVTYAGDNWSKAASDAQEFAQIQRAAWEMAETGAAPNPFASPSEAEILAAEMRDRKLKLEDEKRKSLAQTYGGEEFQKAPPSALLYGQSETYTEYTPDGQPIKPNSVEPGEMPKSKYPEDVYENNHTTVWGSYFNAGRWGYACCHQLMRLAFCTGPPRESSIQVVTQLSKEQNFEPSSDLESSSSSSHGRSRSRDRSSSKHKKHRKSHRSSKNSRSRSPSRKGERKHDRKSSHRKDSKHRKRSRSRSSSPARPKHHKRKRSRSSSPNSNRSKKSRI